MVHAEMVVLLKASPHCRTPRWATFVLPDVEQSCLAIVVVKSNGRRTAALRCGPTVERFLKTPLSTEEQTIFVDAPCCAIRFFRWAPAVVMSDRQLRGKSLTPIHADITSVRLDEEESLARSKRPRKDRTFPTAPSVRPYLHEQVGWAQLGTSIDHRTRLPRCLPPSFVEKCAISDQPDRPGRLRRFTECHLPEVVGSTRTLSHPAAKPQKDRPSGAMPWDSFRRKKRPSRSKDDIAPAVGCFSKASSSSLEGRQRDLPKEVYQKIKEIDQQTSTLSASNPVGLSARILDRYEYVQQLPNGQEKTYICQTVEMIKKPGQTLGIYLREGNGIDRSSGVFVSRLMEGCDVEKACVLSAGDEIVSVNDVDVTRTSIDDVVVMISIPRRLLLRIRSEKRDPKSAVAFPLPARPMEKPIVVLKQMPREDSKDSVMTDESKPLASSQPLTTAQTSLGTRARLQALNSSTIEPPAEAPCGSKQNIFRKSYPAAGSKTVNEGGLTAQHLGVDQPPARSMSDRWSYSRQLAMHTPRILDGEGRPVGGDGLRRAEQSSPQKLQSGKLSIAADGSTLFHTAYILPPKLQNVSLPSGERTAASRSDRPPSSRLDTLSYGHYKVPSSLPDSVNTANLALYSPRTVVSDSEACTSTYEFAQRCLGARTSTGRAPGSGRALRYPRPNVREPVVGSMKSNSLPRLHNRRTIRWSSELVTKTDEGSLPQTTADVSDSDGVVSAPELSLSPVKYVTDKSGQQPSAKTIDEVFSRAEYQAWVNSTNRQTALRQKPELRPHKEKEPQEPGPSRVSAKSRSSSMPPHGILLPEVPHRTGEPLNLERSPQVSRYPIDISPLPRRRYPLQIASSNVSSFFTSVSPTSADGQSASSPFTGLLIIQIFEGRFLRASNDTEELYCVIEVDSEHRARTEVKNRAVKFQWRESFEIDVWESRVVELYIYSWHPQFRHKLRHRGSLQLLDPLLMPSLLENRSQSFALNLEPRGQLILRLGFLSMLLMYRRQLALRPSTYWGIPLPTLVERESSGYEVPILVIRLIQEIERRGLDSIGLYVLCGSVEKKLCLVSEIETNPLSADLGAEAVPDINVLTSVFKDWLCALPEPLISSCTYQTLVDAWRVCIPEDKEGNIRLIFGVLDCLPNINKCTLIAVMDHLKCVLSQAPYNGLTAAKLCRIFAPLLFCTSVATCVKDKSSNISLLDHKLATRLMGTVLNLWPSRMNNSDSNDSENGASTGPLTKDPVSLINMYWKGGKIPESSC
uniref:Rho-GAP domain-containing protein n=1 Tax=Trichuris muris TaxID=70415 RepID=A0A5S6Q800_TRIMR